MHAFTLRSSRSTVQAPQAPSLHPFLVPVSSTRSRSRSRRVTRASCWTERTTPLSLKRVVSVRVAGGAAPDDTAASAGASGAVPAAAATKPAPFNSARLETRRSDIGYRTPEGEQCKEGCACSSLDFIPERTLLGTVPEVSADRSREIPDIPRMSRRDQVADRKSTRLNS